MSGTTPATRPTCAPQLAPPWTPASGPPGASATRTAEDVRLSTPPDSSDTDQLILTDSAGHKMLRLVRVGQGALTSLARAPLAGTSLRAVLRRSRVPLRRSAPLTDSSRPKNGPLWAGPRTPPLWPRWSDPLRVVLLVQVKSPPSAGGSVPRVRSASRAEQSPTAHGPAPICAIEAATDQEVVSDAVVRDEDDVGVEPSLGCHAAQRTCRDGMHLFDIRE